MRHFIRPGDSRAVAFPCDGGVTSGHGVLVGAIFGVAAVGAAQNVVAECQTRGVFDITKEPALASTAGARLFWDNANRRLAMTLTWDVAAATPTGFTPITRQPPIWASGMSQLQNAVARLSEASFDAGVNLTDPTKTPWRCKASRRRWCRQPRRG